MNVSKARMIAKYKDKVIAARQRGDMKMAQKYSLILRDIIQSDSSAMGNVYAAQMEHDEMEVPADFGYQSEVMAHQIETEMENIGHDKALQLAKEQLSNSKLDEHERFIHSDQETLNTLAQSMKVNKAFRGAENTITNESGHGDFSNDEKEKRIRDRVIMQRLSHFGVDFSNYADEFCHGVESVKHHASDFNASQNDKSIQITGNMKADFDNDGTTDIWGEPKLYPVFNNSQVLQAGKARIARNIDFIPRSSLSKSHSKFLLAIAALPASSKANIEINVVKTKTNILDKIKELFFK